MLLQESHQIINALHRLLPSGLVFIIDTLDRSFLYCSPNNHDCRELILSVDREHGLEKISEPQKLFMHEQDGKFLRLKKISQNTFLGFCYHSTQLGASSLRKAEDILGNA